MNSDQKRSIEEEIEMVSFKSRVQLAPCLSKVGTDPLGVRKIVSTVFVESRRDGLAIIERPLPHPAEARY